MLKHTDWKFICHEYEISCFLDSFGLQFDTIDSLNTMIDEECEDLEIENQMIKNALYGKGKLMKSPMISCNTDKLSFEDEWNNVNLFNMMISKSE